MSKLNKTLTDWVSNNLITSEQADQISAYEEAKPSYSWVLYGFLILGVVTIGIGVISLIASNWKDIPGGLKLIIDLLLLIAVATATYRSWDKKKPILFEALLLFFMILCMATIGLIAQVYHTSGEAYQVLLFWSFLTCGLAMASKKSFAPFLWATGFFSGVTLLMYNALGIHLIFQENPVPIFMTIPLLSALFALIFRQITGESGQTKAFRLWTLIGGLIALVIAELQILDRTPPDLNYSGFFLGYALSLILAFGIWRNSKLKKAQKYLLLLTLGLYLIPFHLSMLLIDSQVICATFSIAILSTMAIFLASIGLRNLFQLFLVAIGIRFLILYFQAFGGLATTGFGLIISGVIIISAVVLWSKYRQKITTWAEDVIQ